MLDEMTNPYDDRVTVFAKTNFRNQAKVFGIKNADRRSHMYVIGKTGTGKTNLLSTLIRQDLRNGGGLAVFDPHADLIDKALASVPEARKNDVIYIDVADRAHLFGFNPLENVPVKRRPLAASGLLEVFKKLWSDSWGPRLEHILRNSLLTLLDQPQSTLSDILRLLHDQSFRRHAAERAQNSHVRDFWFQEFDRYPANFRRRHSLRLKTKWERFFPILIYQTSFPSPKVRSTCEQ
jgi:hypothetical protein